MGAVVLGSIRGRFVILAVAAALIFLLVLQLPKVAAITGVKEQAAEQPAE